MTKKKAKNIPTTASNLVTIGRAKRDLSRLVAKVEAGEEITIVRKGQPIARLIALDATPPKRRPGSHKGEFHVGPEFFEPLPDQEDWE